MRISLRTASATAGVLAAFATVPVRAQLPTLSQQPWMGYFAAYEGKRFHIGLKGQGDIELSPLNSRGNRVSHQLGIDIRTVIEETLPDGKVRTHRLVPESLVSKDPASAGLEKTSFQGKTADNAAAEIFFEQSRGIVFVGGRILDRGKLAKNPVRFVVTTRFPSVYPHVKKGDPLADDRESKKEAKAFQKRIEDDRIEIKTTDGKRIKQTFDVEVDASSKELNGAGIASAEIEIQGYQGRRFTLTAAPGSAMALSNSKPAPLHEGFTVTWAADAGKDPEGKARLAIEVR